MDRVERKRAYRVFLQSDFWKALSKAKRELAGKCERCRSRENLQAHHTVYRSNWYETKMEDLKVLCRGCHRKEHGLGVGRRFMYFREDERMNAYFHRCSCLNDMIYSGRKLRPRDKSFLALALNRYPPQPKDTAMEFHVKNVLELNFRKFGE